MRLRERFFSRWRNANKIGIFFYYGGIKKYFIVEAGTRRRKTAAGPAIWSTSLAIWIVSLLFFFSFFPSYFSLFILLSIPLFLFFFRVRCFWKRNGKWQPCVERLLLLLLLLVL